MNWACSERREAKRHSPPGRLGGGPTDWATCSVVSYLDRRRANSFGDDAEQYDRARPPYPAELIDHLTRDHPVDVLDAGCGTGIAARLLAARGCRLLGVEPDARMAAVARRHGLLVEQATFEEWDPAGRRFDLLTSGQAWHWIDPARGSARAAEVLRPGGRLAVFWNRGQPPDELREALADAYRRVAPEPGRGLALPSGASGGPDQDCHRAAVTFATSPDFDQVSIRPFTHVIGYTTNQWLDQLPTHSDHRTLPRAQLDALMTEVAGVVDANGGRFEVRFTTWLVEARRLGSASPP